MNLKLVRKTFTEKSTIGELYINGDFECFTLEDCVREVQGQPIEKWKIKGKTAIPLGNYEVILDYSNRFKKIMPHILGVEGFIGVRIHAGNTHQDTDGCILVGLKKGNDFIYNSVIARDILVKKMEIALNRDETIFMRITGDKNVDS